MNNREPNQAIHPIAASAAQDDGCRWPSHMNENLQTYEGIYVSHWEVARFVVTTGRRLFGLLPRIEKWQAIFPGEVVLPFKSEPPTGRDNGHYFKMTVAGTLGPQGHFGHMGICTRELQISKVISCVETESPGKVW